ncbi:CD109 antigen-like isoform X5 [Schistocerca serialis cubense]|uniref:CD109 antigen-like isoform X5 n=1 Tax=Schistocerca serialis cubense TaxID=2023355 RepID=UPI00214EE046|nr:CD109 antigen-like isoform X5 [Schistocerca serialis cubense]
MAAVFRGAWSRCSLCARRLFTAAVPPGDKGSRPRKDLLPEREPPGGSLSTCLFGRGWTIIMLRALFLVLLLALLRVWMVCGQQGYYTIVAPKVLRPNSEYHVAVSTQFVSEPCDIVVTVGGKQDVGSNFVTSQMITVEPYTTRIVKLEIGDLGSGIYKLIVKGEKGLVFENSTNVDYIHKSYSVFIQTDKAIYKPGHKVMFRAIVLNSHLKPSVTGALDIYITDGRGNRVKQWRRALTTKGVFSGELQLSESPVLGDWNIVVNVLDQTFSKTFQVAEYVLPKFEVTIDVPPYVTFKNSKVAAVVHAKYTYGKPVKGEATVTMYPNYFSSILQPAFQNPVRKVVTIDGKAVVEFDPAKELNLNDEYARNVQFEVAVEEALTGRRQNNSAQVTVHKYMYKMNLIKTSECFKPGLKYTGYVQLVYQDGKPVRDEKNPVKVSYRFSHGENFTEESFKLSPDGMVTLDFFPDKNATVLEIKAQYLGMEEWFSSILPANSPSNTFIQAVVKTEHPTVNDYVQVEINSTVPLKYFSYQIIGRGDIVIARTVQVSQSVPMFKFLATYAMAPTAHVVVFYMAEDGEVIADALDIELKGTLQNFVTVEANPNETEPGGTVDLKIEAKANSYVGLLGIDQSVLLLKGGHDITEDDVLKELHSYDASTKSPYIDGLRDKRSLFWRPGSSEAKEIFDNSGVVVLTNGLVYENMVDIYYRSGVGDDFMLDNEESAIDLAPLPSMVSGDEGIRVRSHFPETWIWEMLDAGQSGKTSLKSKVPDTITSWILTAFSVDTLFGLGLIETPQKVRVFRPFFISIDLPYSVIRGEIVAIPIVVFNYMDKDVVADVTLEKVELGTFDFAEVSNEVSSVNKVELYRKKQVTVKANSGSSVSFMITPKKLGHITIQVNAKSPLAGDAVSRQLFVKAEGETQYRNKAFFIDLRSTNSHKTNVTLEIPRSSVPGSEQIEVSAVGDILGPSIFNLDKLIKMPYGCGEQNMLNFVPNIVVMEYLKNTDQLTPAVETKALKHMEKGYQQELTYRRDDGSFSAFGNSDQHGSTWLTAYVTKSFSQAMSYVPVEDRVIEEALRWLSNNQAADGSFPEVGKVSHSAMQGGAAKGLALTAYTLITFLESQRYRQMYHNTINKAVEYIVRNIDSINDTYAIAITAYALHLADHTAKDAAFNILESRAKTEGDMKWWSRSLGQEDEKNPWHSLPNSVNVEMTSYALLTYLLNNHVADSFPILRWLVSQQNEEGGFSSTQDTVVGLHALAQLAQHINSRSTSMAVNITYQNGGSVIFNINRQNSMILQKRELSSKVREVNITATGTGFAIMQVSYRYNVNVTGAWPLFTLDPQVDKNSDRNHLQLSICSAFAAGQSANESNMAVMEVSLPSGFTVDSDSLPSLEVSQNVKRVETKDGDTVVVLYFDKMTRQEYCPTISAYRTHKVAKQKPVPVSIYDYYDSSRRARVFYEPRVATLCDICEDEDCDSVCSSKSSGRSGGSDGSAGSAAPVPLPSHLLVLLMFAVCLPVGLATQH